MRSEGEEYSQAAVTTHGSSYFGFELNGRYARWKSPEICGRISMIQSSREESINYVLHLLVKWETINSDAPLEARTGTLRSHVDADAIILR